MGAVIDWLRRRVPDAMAARLPLRNRRKHFRARLAAGEFERLAALVQPVDPFPDGALWTAVDRLLAGGRPDALPRLALLAAGRPPFDLAVFGALELVAREGKEAAAARLDELGSRDGFGSFERMCARCWARFLMMPDWRAAPAASSGPVICQFWDRPDPPPDVAAAMALWAAAAPGRYRRFDDASARAFIAERYGPAEVAAYDICGHSAIRADYFRLGYLAAEGGLWVDADCRPRHSFVRAASRLTGRTVLWFNPLTGHWLNGLIAAERGSAILGAAFADAGTRIRRDPSAHPYVLAGPGLLSDTILWTLREGAAEPAACIVTCDVSGRLVESFEPAYKRAGGSWQSWLAHKEAMP